MDDVILTHSLTTKGNNSNILVVGSCRTGKTNFFVKPNLFLIKDSVIIIGRNDDHIDETIEYRKERFKQNIFKMTIPDLKDNKNYKWTSYLLESPFNKKERDLIIQYAQTMLTDYLEKNSEDYPVTLIIDDLDLFHFDKQFFLEMLKQGESHGLRIIAIIQSINLLTRLYGREDVKAILKKFKIKMFFGDNDPGDGEYLEPSIKIEEIMLLQSSECVVTGLKDKPIFKKDRITHWFSHGKHINL